MRFTATEVQGDVCHRPRAAQRLGAAISPARGARKEFEAQGLTARLVQVNVSSNVVKGTLRGMHYQLAPFEEAKVVSCTRGAIWDVALDLRPESPTYLRWAAAELAGDNRRMLYVPEGCAHGFQTLTDGPSCSI